MLMAWVGSVEEESEELQLEILSISESRTEVGVLLVSGVPIVPLLLKKEVALLLVLFLLIKFRPLMARVIPNLLDDTTPSPPPPVVRRGF